MASRPSAATRSRIRPGCQPGDRGLPSRASITGTMSGSVMPRKKRLPPPRPSSASPPRRATVAVIRLAIGLAVHDHPVAIEDHQPQRDARPAHQTAPASCRHALRQGGPHMRAVPVRGGQAPGAERSCAAPRRAPAPPAPRAASAAMNPASLFCAGAAEIAGDALFAREVAIFHVELDQRLRMLRHEGDGHHQQRHLVRGRVLDLLLGRGGDPFLRRGAGLVAHAVIETRDVQLARRPPPPSARSGTGRDRPWRTIVSGRPWAENSTRSGMAGIELRARLGVAAPHDRRRRRHEAGIHRIAAQGAHRLDQPRLSPPPPARRSANCRSWWWSNADRAAAAPPRPGPSPAPRARPRG